MESTQTTSGTNDLKIPAILLPTKRNKTDPGGLAVRDVGLRALDCWDREFESL